MPIITIFCCVSSDLHCSYLGFYMQTKCEFCGFVQNVPKPYKDKEIKCSSCKETFVAKRYLPPKYFPAPDTGSTPERPNGYASKGIVAIIIGLILITFAAICYSSWCHRELQNTKENAALWQLGAVPVARYWPDELEMLCGNFGKLELAADLKGFSMSEDTRCRIIDHLNFEIKILNLPVSTEPVRIARNALVKAMQAEISVLEFEQQHAIENDKHGRLLGNKEYVRLMEHSMELRGEAMVKINKLVYNENFKRQWLRLTNENT